MSADGGRPRSVGAWIAISIRRLLAWAGAIAIVGTTLFATRVFAVSGFHFTLFGLFLLALVCMVPVRPVWPQSGVGRAVAPVAAFAAVSVVVYVAAAARFGSQAGVFVTFLLVPLAWIGAAVLGFRSRAEGTLPIGAAAGAAAVVSIAAAVVDISHRVGLVTRVGTAYEAWGVAVRAWQPSASELFRAVGFEVDPNTFGLIGAVIFVIALALPMRSWTRGLLAAGAIAIVGFSESRTAAGAVILALVTYLVIEFTSSGDRAESVRAATPIIIGLVIATVVITLSVGLVHGSLATRVEQSAAEVSGEASPGVSEATAVDESLNGRLKIWTAALELYRGHPLGIFLPPEEFLRESVHNEYIERLLIGGPLMLATLLAFLWWLFVRLRPSSARALGPCLAVSFAAAAFALGPSLLPAFTTLLFYAVGWGQAERRKDKEAGAGVAPTRPETPAPRELVSVG